MTSTEKLVERLRNPGNLHGGWLDQMNEAADAIEAQDARIADLEAALTPSRICKRPGMSRLGKRQIEFLASMAGTHRALVVPDALTRSLCRRGLMKPGGTKTDGFIVLTADGYRAVADALEGGAIDRPPVEEWARKAKP